MKKVIVLMLLVLIGFVGMVSISENLHAKGHCEAGLRACAKYANSQAEMLDCVRGYLSCVKR